MRLHHVQLMMPTDGHGLARAFWVDAVGLTEVPKPAALAVRGGCWFRAFAPDGSVTVEIHASPTEDFSPALRAHPALLLDSVDELEQLAGRIAGGGFEVSWADRDTFDGYVRFHCRDGFGNRVEVLTPVGA